MGEVTSQRCNIEGSSAKNSLNCHVRFVPIVCLVDIPGNIRSLSYMILRQACNPSSGPAGERAGRCECQDHGYIRALGIATDTKTSRPS